MSVVTVTATVEASHIPPRVRLDVVDSGSPAVTSTTVVRINPDGTQVPVRTTDGAPLSLTVSGSVRTGLLYDYESPYGAAVSYSSTSSPGVVSSQVTIDEGQVWLIHPGVPSLSMVVDLRDGTWDEETLPVQQAILRPQGRRNAVALSSGARGGPESGLVVAIESAPQLQELRALVADAGVLLLNVPPLLGLGVATDYIAIGDVQIRRPANMGPGPLRSVVMPYVVTDRPIGGSQAERTYADLLVHATYADLAAAYPTYADLQAGP